MTSPLLRCDCGLMFVPAEERESEGWFCPRCGMDESGLILLDERVEEKFFEAIVQIGWSMSERRILTRQCRIMGPVRKTREKP